MKNYLVTGGAGFIGSWIARKLITNGCKVTIIDDLSTGYQENVPSGAVFIKGDCAKAETIDALDDVYFDAILHIAGQSSGEISFLDPVRDLQSNTQSTLLLLDYARRNDIKKVVYASTMSVYGEMLGKDCFSENDDVNPKSLYAVGKLASENYLKIYQKQYGINFSILRYFNVYGEGQNLSNMKQGMVSIYLKQFLDDAYDMVVVKGSLKRFRDQTHVDDVSNLTMLAIENPLFNNQTVNIGTGIKTTVEDVLMVIESETGSNKEICISDGTKGDQFGIYANIDKLKSIKNYKFIPFKQGAKRMIDWINKSE